MIKHMATVPTSTQTEPYTWVSGVKTSSMGEVLKSGRMVPSTRAATKTAKSTAMEFSLLPMAPPIQASLRTMRYLDLENTSGPTTKFTRACGKETRCTAKES